MATWLQLLFVHALIWDLTVFANDVAIIQIDPDAASTTRRVYSMDLSGLQDDSVEINRVDITKVDPLIDNIDFFATFHGFRLDIHAKILEPATLKQSFEMIVQITDLPVPEVYGVKHWHYKPVYDENGVLTSGGDLPPLQDFRQYRRYNTSFDFTVEIQQ